MSKEHLISITQIPADDRYKICSAGGKASQAKQKARRTQAEIVRAIMELELTREEGAESLIAMGLEPTWATDANIAVMRKARRGDVDAMRYLRDTMGEKPREGLEIGNLDGKPLETVDFSKLTDDQLKAMIAMRSEGEND